VSIVSSAAQTNGSSREGREISVGIVGAGFGGVGMGIRLKQEGIENFTIFERGDSVGGVWRANTYPGAACDVPSHLYSYSFAPGSKWSKRYAPQTEIKAYLEECANDFGIPAHLAANTEIVSADFDPASGTWTLTDDGGGTHDFDVVVSACGQLTRPSYPPAPGIEDFEGHSFHSAEWDHDHPLDGRKVAVIGTGASAIQFAPEIAPIVDRMTIYQRSAPWVLPKSDRAYPEWERRLFERFPARVAASRLGLFGFFEAGTHGFTGKHWVLRPLEAAALANQRWQLRKRPELIEPTTPSYKFGCKRVLFTSEWYPTLARDNVELLDGAIQRVTATGVIGADGIERPADTIIWGTGFQSHNFVAPMRINGLDGRELNDVWAERPEAFLGSTMSGFPNLFMLYGPNTNHGSGSVIYTLECQFNYALDAVRRLGEQGLRYIELKPEAMAEWRAEIDERSAPSVWTTGGCDNWYLNAEGANTNNWPAGWLEFRRRTKRLDPGHYRAAA